jgi:virginiamycin B lyase
MTPSRIASSVSQRQLDAALKWSLTRSAFAVRTRLTSALVAAAMAVAVALALASPADAYVYWANDGGNTIGRANLDGTGANQSFIAGATDPAQMAVDGGHVYWANSTRDAIGRANLDGSSPNQTFITTASSTYGVAVDSAHVYWMNGTSIGRANLDGSSPNQSFITGANSPVQIAVDSAHVYWAGQQGNTIGRANLDGTGVNNNFITGVNGPVGVAVDGAHVYWTNSSGTAIGRANLDGTSANESFISGASAPTGVAVDSTHIYWANESTGTIGRANLDGTGANQSLVTGRADGVAVDALTTPGQFCTTTRNDGPTGLAIDGLSPASESPCGRFGPTLGSLPVANSDLLIVPGHAARLVNVLRNDRDPDGDRLAVSQWSQGRFGAVSCATTTCRYRPSQRYRGFDSFTYTVADGRDGSSRARVFVRRVPLPLTTRHRHAASGRIRITCPGCNADFRKHEQSARGLARLAADCREYPYIVPFGAGFVDTFLATIFGAHQLSVLMCIDSHNRMHIAGPHSYVMRAAVFSSSGPCPPPVVGTCRTEVTAGICGLTKIDNVEFIRYVPRRKDLWAISERVDWHLVVSTDGVHVGMRVCQLLTRSSERSYPTVGYTFFETLVDPSTAQVTTLDKTRLTNPAFTRNAIGRLLFARLAFPPLVI